MIGGMVVFHAILIAAMVSGMIVLLLFKGTFEAPVLWGIRTFLSFCCLLFAASCLYQRRSYFETFVTGYFLSDFLQRITDFPVESVPPG